MASIRISIGAPDPNLSDAWRSLAARAPANVFMDFAGLCAAASTGYADIAVLQAWESGAGTEQLVGAWALRNTTMTPLGPAYLAGPPHFYSFLSNPVVDPAYQDAVMPAFFDAIAGNSALPKVVRLQYLRRRGAELCRDHGGHQDARRPEQAVVGSRPAVSGGGCRPETLRFDPQEVAPGLESPVRARRRRCRQYARTGRRARSLRNVPDAGSRKLERQCRHRGAERRQPCRLRPAVHRQSRCRGQCLGRAFAPGWPAGRRTGAALCRRHGLHLEDRL